MSNSGESTKRSATLSGVCAPESRTLVQYSTSASAG